MPKVANKKKTKGKVTKIEDYNPSTWEEAIEEFIYLKKAQGRSEGTIDDYQRHAKYFFNRYPKAFNSFRSLKTAVLKYMSDDIKPNTFNRRRQYLNGFFSWCVEEGILERNPFDNIPKKKDEFRNVNLDIETIKQLLQLPDTATWSGLRDYGLIILTLDTGIRPSEAFSLLPSDANLKSGEIIIRSENAKTRVARTLPMKHPSIDAIKRLLHARHRAWKENTPIFCTYQGTKLNRKAWQERLVIYSKTLEVKICPYDLRHCFALQYLRNGGNALSLQRTLGHSDLSMTRRYVALTEGDLKAQHNDASPLNTFLPQKRRVKNI